MAIKKINGKKGVVFTLIGLIIALPLFLLASSFLSKNNELLDDYTASAEADKISHIESDITKNAYHDLLSFNIASITRDSSSVKVNTNQIVLKNTTYFNITNSYKNFAENSYAKLVNANISLIGFDTTLKITPYNSTFNINGTSLFLYTMPTSTNYVKSVALTVKINSSFKGGCGQPANDPGSFPSVTTVSVTYINISGSACTKSRNLVPTENNDRGNGKQFEQDLNEPTGSIETKFGEVDGIDGILAVYYSSKTAANISQLDIEYSVIDEQVAIVGGNISIATPNIKKSTDIILIEE